MFCGILVRKDSKHPDRNRLAIIRTLLFRDKILSICNDRKDDWAEDVQLRIMSCSDLVAPGAIYHYNYYQRFAVNLEKDSVKKPSIGRLVVKDLDAKFNLLFEWLESEAEVHLLAELKGKMEELSDSTEVYSIKWIKARLIKKYTD